MNKLEKVELENGLTIYLYEDKRRHSTFFQFITKFGGTTKNFKVNGKTYHMQDGIAHLLEHYIVECNNQGNFLKKLGEKQMNTNAFTHNLMTRFYFEAVVDVEYGINTLLNGIYDIDFSEEKLEKIKKPIFQEIRGKSNNKFYHSNIEQISSLFHNMNFRSIGGTIEEIEKTTVNDVKICYDTFYQPKNQIIVIGGNFNRESILELINAFYKDKDFSENNFEIIKNTNDDTIRRKEATVYFPTPQEYVEIAYKINISKFSPKERVTLDFYLHNFYTMYFGVTSTIYNELVKDKIITTGISSGHTIFDDYLIMFIGTFTDSKDVFIKKITDEMKILNKFKEDIFNLEKQSSLVSITLRDENIMHTLMPFVDNLICYDYPYLDTKEDIESLNYLQFVDTIKNFDFSNYTIINIMNKNNNI